MGFYIENQEGIAPTNFKPATAFDSNHGTTISQQFKFPFNFSSDDVYETFSWCRLHEYLPTLPRNMTDAYCDKWENIIRSLSYEHFPYQGIESLDNYIKEDVLCGMASEFNFDDIVYFSIKGIKSYMNVAVNEELTRTFTPNVIHDIQWVISPETLEKMKEEITDRKLSMSTIAKETE